MGVRQKNGLRSLQVWKHRHANRNRDAQFKEKKMELALRTELLHRLEVQLTTADAVMIEVAEKVLPTFLVVLESPSVSEMYDFEQKDVTLFVFWAKTII